MTPARTAIENRPGSGRGVSEELSVLTKEVHVPPSETVDDLTPENARQHLVDQLSAQGWVTRPHIRAAFAAIPRHLFTPPGTTVGAAYADDAVITKRGPDGKATSSLSAPWLQAYMLSQADLRPGNRVPEIGSGGYNAALVAHIVGPTGTVVSIDIDPGIVANAQTALAGTDYHNVSIVCADGEFGYVPDAPYNAIMVTVNATDISPQWWHQVKPGGRLIVPLRMRGITRCLTRHHHDDHLTATSAIQCGFVTMQGFGRHLPRQHQLQGDDIVLLIDDPQPANIDGEALRTALHGSRTHLWSGVTIADGDGAGFESIHLWLASQNQPFATLAVDRARTSNLVDPQDRFFCPTFVTPDSFAYLATRKVTDPIRVRGARLRPDRRTTRQWHVRGDHRLGPRAPAHHRCKHRHLPGRHTHPRTTQPRLLVPRQHVTAVITWPGNQQ